MTKSRVATTAVILLAADIACTQTVKTKQEFKPYTIQNDVLGESLADFQKNQKCTPEPDRNGVEGAQTCIALYTHYAGMPVLGKEGLFYQGHLYKVGIAASTEDCQKANLLSLLKERYGEPKLTEIKDGHEMTPPALKDDAPFKIWQNGKETIEFQESMGGNVPTDSMASCSLSFTVDAVDREVSRLQQEKRRKEKEAKKKDM